LLSTSLESEALRILEEDQVMSRSAHSAKVMVGRRSTARMVEELRAALKKPEELLTREDPPGPPPSWPDEVVAQRISSLIQELDRLELARGWLRTGKLVFVRQSAERCIFIVT